MQTVVHVTHEAIQKIGGIGAVLQGLLTSKVYLGPASAQHPRRPVLAERRTRRAAPRRRRAKCSTAAWISLYRSPLAARFREIEQTFDVGIVYGRRRFVDKDTGVDQHAGSAADRRRAATTRRRSARSNSRSGKRSASKAASTNTSGISSSTCGWPQPAIAALHALGAASAAEPCVILSPRIHGHADRAGGHPGRRRGQLPHDLLRPRSARRCAGSSRAIPATTRCFTT